jgi:molybdopterin-synthase adenylyltransferase
MDNDDRYSRQRDIIPLEKLAACRATVIGVCAIGRQVALQLAAMGIPWLQLVDFDVVEPSNLCSQGYWEKDLGRLKVEATADLCREINHSLELCPISTRFRRSLSIGRAVFCCVDQIDTRRQIWQTVQHRIDVFCDGRMAAEVLRVVTVADAAGRWRYPTTLFANQDAYAGSCTAKATIYCANVAAGLMLAQFTKWLRHLPVDFDCQFNLLSSEMAVDPSGKEANLGTLCANPSSPAWADWAGILSYLTPA